GIFRNYIYIRTIKNEMVLVNQNDLSENDVKELKSLLSQNLKEETL
ncbi:YcxB family protein, partial [Coprococcus comes]|nr:YcxB family protein [Coprococcus comes]